MKKVIIKEENKKRIEEVLKEVQGRCTVRKIDYDDIIKACDKIIKKFQIPKKCLEGCEFIYRKHADDVPQAYKYTYEGTVIRLIMKNGKFQLIDCFRGDCNHVKEFTCEITDECKKNVLWNFKRWNG